MNKGLFSKVVVVLVILLNAFFTWQVLTIVQLGLPEPTVLITAWFGFTTVELWSLASIKKKKEEKELKLYEAEYDDSAYGG